MKFYDLMSRIKSGCLFTVIIKSKTRKIVFCASYCTEHYPDEEYFKVFFDDGTVLEIMPNTEDLYFCDDMRRKIDRNLITDFGEHLKIDGKEYLLDNSNDKQFVKKIYYGDIKDGEGECVFSDYGLADEIWSLATLDDGRVSDIHAEKISIDDISIN